MLNYNIYNYNDNGHFFIHKKGHITNNVKDKQESPNLSMTVESYN